MNAKPILIGLSVVLVCALLTLMVHAPAIAGYLPEECPKCHLPTAFEYDGKNWPGKFEDAPAYRCAKCGVDWWQPEIDVHKTALVDWGALLAEVMGQTDSGPLPADQQSQPY